VTRRNPEHQLQVSIRQYLELALPPSILWTASLTGVNLSMRARTKAKAAGVKRGFPDLQFVFPDGITRYIELKAGAGLSPEQRAFRDHCQGVRPAVDIWEVCRSIDEVADTLRRWGARLRDTEGSLPPWRAPTEIAREEAGQP
jgi:hypothetical protein